VFLGGNVSVSGNIRSAAIVVAIIQNAGTYPFGRRVTNDTWCILNLAGGPADANLESGVYS